MKIDLNSASIATSLLIITMLLMLWYVRWSERNTPKRRSGRKSS